jgi:hypothetical protein
VKIRPVILVAAAVVVFGACSNTGSTTPPSSQAASPSAAPMSHEPESMAPPASGGAIVIDSAAADLRTQLNLALAEHIIFASKATGAALGSRADEFAAYGELLNTNGTDIGAAIGGLYGDDAKDQFNQIWSAHNGFFVDYTTGVATDDQAKQDQAVQDLTTVYVPQFADFLAAATGLPKDALTDLIGEHVLTTKAIVDAQAAGDWEAIATADRTAGQHMVMIGDPLAKAIVIKLPEQFAS